MDNEHASGAMPTSEELAELKLGARLERNLSDYNASLLDVGKRDIIGNAREIAAMNDTHEYLTEDHAFSAEEVAFLLRFENPLRVVADHWPTQNGLIDVSHVMRDILHKPETLQRRYAPASGETEKAQAAAPARESRDELFELIARKHCHVETLEERKRDSLDFHDVSVWGLKAALEAAFEAGMERQAERLRETTRAEKPSVLEQIREAARAPKEPHNEKSVRKKSGPEL